MDPLVIVVGSINLDTTLDVVRLPGPGQTVLAGRLRTAVGGKGANQAAASALQGVATALVAGVGDDAAGRSLLDAVAAVGVDVQRCRVIAGSPSGQALITVDQAGANTIVVAAGANAALSAVSASAVGNPKVVLVQLEIPVDAVHAALAAGRAVGAVTILNPAPARPLDAALLSLCDVVVPNEHEAAELTGIADPAHAAAALAESAGGATVIVTCGARGAILYRDGSTVEVPAVLVDAVDTVAAGDAFCGVLAASIAERHPLEEAVRRATAAGAHAVTVAGALPSLPNRMQIDALLDR